MVSQIGVLLMTFFQFYFFQYRIFNDHGLTHPLLDKIIRGLYKSGVFDSIVFPLASLFAIVLFTLSQEGKKSTKINIKRAYVNTGIGVIGLLTISVFVKEFNGYLYMVLYISMLLLIINGLSKFRRVFNKSPISDRFNLENKVFDQPTELIENELSVNIPMKYVHKYKRRGGEFIPLMKQGYVNIVAPNRATMILGKPGSGKSYSFNEEFLKQHIMKCFAIANYDFKFPTLTNAAYNYYLTYGKNYQSKYGKKVDFRTICIADPRYSDRCNPVKPELISTKPDAMDAIYTIFYNIDKKSAVKPDFFQMSAMSLTSAVLWFLKLYENGKYCSIPHMIEFLQRKDSDILPILASYPELYYFTSSFSDALEKEAFEQLSGQTASARIPLGKMATDELFWVMTDPDDTGVDLRINRKEAVTILNIANHPSSQKANSPALGLYMSQLAKLVNEQGRVPCNFHVDELPTIYINGLDNLIATARSNKVCTTLAFQDYSQLKRDYGSEIAESIWGTIDNIISGKVSPETAGKINKAIGKVEFETTSVSLNKDSSESRSSRSMDLIPTEAICQLSQGEFVGVLSDTFDQHLDKKIFRGFVSPDKSDLGNKEVPMVYPDLTAELLAENTKKIQTEIDNIIKEELSRINLANNNDAPGQDISMDSEGPFQQSPFTEDMLEDYFPEDQTVLEIHSALVEPKA